MGGQRIIVVGAGVVGLATAWFLQERGYETIIVDRRAGPGLETSFANGGLLTPSMSQPWNEPGCWSLLLRSLVRSDSPLMIRWRTMPELAGWGSRFLLNSGARRFARNTNANFALAHYSLRELADRLPIAPGDYDGAATGTLRLFRQRLAFDKAAKNVAKLATAGIRSEMLSGDDCVKLEPSLEPIREGLEGAVQFPDDRVGDAYRFCQALERELVGRGTEFRYSTNVRRFLTAQGQVAGFETDEGEWQADQIVVAAGSHATPLAASLGFSLPIRPAKGYSITIDASGLALQPRIPLVDDQHHAVITPIGSMLRVAGTAEFAGYDISIDPSRVRNLLDLLSRVFPDVAVEPHDAKPWAGLRAMSADGVPIVGETPVRNLWLNVGHGHLGWTMAAGAGALLADLISGSPTQIDASRYALSRFGGFFSGA